LLAVKKVVSKWVEKEVEILEDVMIVVEIAAVVVVKVATAEADKVVEALTAVAVELEDKVVAKASKVEEDRNKFNFSNYQIDIKCYSRKEQSTGKCRKAA
jgi:hypothetical protein